MITYTLSITYNPKDIYPEMDSINAVGQIDEELKEICGEDNVTGSGMMLGEGERDIDFEYGTKEEANSKMKEIKRKFGKHMMVGVYDYDDAEDIDIFEK